MEIKDEVAGGDLPSGEPRSNLLSSEVNRQQYEGCDKKNFYDDWWSATHYAAQARERAGHDNIYAYKCLFCPGYHIGHRRKNGEKVVLGKTKRCPKCKWVVKIEHYKDHLWTKHGG